jgi:hypothetical protein
MKGLRGGGRFGDGVGGLRARTGEGGGRRFGGGRHGSGGGMLPACSISYALIA